MLTKHSLGVWGRQRSQMADGPCADHFQLPASISKRWPAQENMTAAPRSFRGSLSGGVKKLFTFALERWNESPTCASWSRRELRENNKVAGKEYLTRQAATLLKLARSTKDPQIAAGLVEKAADLKSQVDSAPDRSPHAPDVERQL